ncbi:MAG: hypothetical protein KDD48_06345 [Bdellovibrionales bacterium]|nr:hypothetical protein [Bdellovibrionales bacterium]
MNIQRIVLSLSKHCFFICVFVLGSGALANDDAPSMRSVVERSVDQVKQNLKQTIHEYNIAKDEKTKFLWSMSLYEMTQAGTFSDYPSIELLLNKTEKEKLKKAVMFFETTKRDVKKFEHLLTPIDVKFITRDNPHSVFLQLGRYTHDYNFGSCTTNNIQSILSQMSKEEFYANYLVIGLLAMTYEDFYSFNYRDRINQLIRSDPRFKKFAHLSKTFYEKYHDENDMEETKKELLENQKKAERHLNDFMENKIDDFKKYVSQKVIMSPTCFLGVHPEIQEFVKVNLTLDRGKVWLKKIKRKARSKTSCKKYQTIFRKLSIDRSTIYEASKKDAFNETYHFRDTQKGCEMYSLGPDFENPSDDILIQI